MWRAQSHSVWPLHAQAQMATIAGDDGLIMAISANALTAGFTQCYIDTLPVVIQVAGTDGPCGGFASLSTCVTEAPRRLRGIEARGVELWRWRPLVTVLSALARTDRELV